MPSTSTYISIAVAIITIGLLSLAAFIKGLRDEHSIIATPSISVEDAFITNFGTSRIHATIDEVFDAVLNYKDYSWSSTSRYHWEKNGADGIPLVGSKGTLELAVEGFSFRHIDLELTMLDRKHKRVAERSTTYPAWLLRAERVQEVLPVEGHPKLCEYRTWMTHQGIAASLLILAAKDELEDAQIRCAKDMKIYIESKKHSNTSAQGPRKVIPTTI